MLSEEKIVWVEELSSLLSSELFSELAGSSLEEEEEELLSEDEAGAEEDEEEAG